MRPIVSNHSLNSAKVKTEVTYSGWSLDRLRSKMASYCRHTTIVCANAEKGYNDPSTPAIQKPTKSLFHFSVRANSFRSEKFNTMIQGEPRRLQTLKTPTGCTFSHGLRAFAEVTDVFLEESV